MRYKNPLHIARVRRALPRGSGRTVSTAPLLLLLEARENGILVEFADRDATLNRRNRRCSLLLHDALIAPAIHPLAEDLMDTICGRCGVVDLRRRVVRDTPAEKENRILGGMLEQACFKTELVGEPLHNVFVIHGLNAIEPKSGHLESRTDVRLPLSARSNDKVVADTKRVDNIIGTHDEVLHFFEKGATRVVEIVKQVAMHNGRHGHVCHANRRDVLDQVGEVAHAAILRTSRTLAGNAFLLIYLLLIGTLARFWHHSHVWSGPNKSGFRRNSTTRRIRLATLATAVEPVLSFFGVNASELSCFKCSSVDKSLCNVSRDWAESESVRVSVRRSDSDVKFASLICRERHSLMKRNTPLLPPDPTLSLPIVPTVGQVGHFVNSRKASRTGQE